MHGHHREIRRGRDASAHHAEITEQIPDERIAGRSRSGGSNGGVATFHRIANGRTRIMLQLDYEPRGAVENIGDALGVVSRRVEGGLLRFKDFIELLGGETGAWRGEIRQDRKTA